MFRSESIINSNGIGYVVIYDKDNQQMILDPYQAKQLVRLLQNEIKIVERLEEYYSEDIVEMVENIEFDGDQNA